MLTTLLSTSALALTAVLTIPSAIFAAECITGTLVRPRQAPRLLGKRPVMAVLVPAHNEESGLSGTLKSIRAEMHSNDRLVVVADNCTDNTANIAREAGAEVVERFNDIERGKGFALHAGVQHLAISPPDIVVIVDADCTLSPGTLDNLAGMVSATSGPVQSCYLMTSPADSRLDMAVREFAFVVKNRVRPLGLGAFGLPCQLSGSGMAFPWAIISTANLSNDNLVEDMKLGLDLARIGHAPTYCADALVLSEFPHSTTGAMTQNSRWESGHLAMTKIAFRTLTAGGGLRNLRLAAMALDILIPPLALLVLMLSAMLVVSAVMMVAGMGSAAFVLSVINMLLVMAGIAAAWVNCGSRILPASKLYRLPLYVLRKISFYGKIFGGSAGSGWIRTDRSRSD